MRESEEEKERFMVREIEREGCGARKQGREGEIYGDRSCQDQIRHPYPITWSSRPKSRVGRIGR